jgi:hypothetical protein
VSFYFLSGFGVTAGFLWVPRTTSPSLTSALAASRPQRRRR